MKFYRSIILCFFFLAEVSLLTGQDKPNIILFLVDDMGWQDCSVPFWNKTTNSNDVYETPNMERLAKQGLKFTNAYSNPVCTPTRISLFTGMNVVRHGVTNWTNVHKDQPTDHPDNELIPANWNFNGLSATPGIPHTIQATPLPLLLKQVGYHTIHCGKAHFAPYGTSGSNPLNLGFDINIAGTAAGNPGSFLAEDQYSGKAGDTLWAVRDLDSYVQKGDFLTDALTAEAIHAIENNRSSGKPFFLYLAHYAVHLPFSKDNRYYQKYINKGLSDVEARYAGLIEGMDKSLGEIMDHLEKIGADNNTYIVFLSDNGGLSLVPPRTGNIHSQNLPLKKGKGSLYEGGIRIPMLIAGPGVKLNAVSSQYLIAEDLFSTILEWAGIRDPKVIQEIDGENMNPFIQDPNKKNSRKILLWHYPNNWTNINEHGISWCSAIRKGKWKLIYFHKDQQLELYDLENDIEEKNDLSKSMKGKLKKLSVLMTKKMKERNAQLPISKKTNKPIPWPDEILISN